MKDECLICKAPLEYLVQDEMMECAICHKNELSKTHCMKGHYVCSECHMAGMDSTEPKATVKADTNSRQSISQT